MMSQNVVLRNKLKSRFVLLYIFSILLLSIIFAGLWNIFETVPSTSLVNKQENKAAQASHLQSENKMLYTSFKTIQQLDAVYFMLHSDSADNEKLDSVSSLINRAEASLGNAIDSLRNNKIDLSGIDKKFHDSVINDFSLALTNHRSFNSMRTGLSIENQNTSDSVKALYALQAQINLKNEDIISLENQLNSDQKDLAATSDVPAGPKQQVAMLQGNTEKLKSNITKLEIQNNSLYKSNNQLTAQLKELKSSTTTINVKKADQVKNDYLANKINDLNAQLIFAQVDCNLSKADAKKIISNSKQRKELLQGSLALLNNLSHSNNVAVQKKVKAKLSQLENIAATVRD